jgi:nicotinamide phosphoribosyltransferase
MSKFDKARALAAYEAFKGQTIKINESLSCAWGELEEVMNSVLMDVDSYKVGMPDQYPPGTKIVRSYIESRGGLFDRVLHAGVQPYINKISKPVTARMVEIAAALWAIHGEPFPKEMWDYVVNECGGFLPIRIRSVAEGMIIPTRNVLVVTENTIPDMPYARGLTTWVETGLLRATWYMSSVGTTSWHIKQLVKEYYAKSVDEADIPLSILFRLHDFGSRGVSSAEAAQMGGAAHLFNFMGTDTFTAVPFLMLNYMASADEAGFSIVAAEHSTVTSWKREGEIKAAINMAQRFANPNVPFAFVIDSFDPIEFTKWVSSPDSPVLKILKERNALMVLRPDSGDPTIIIPQMLSILEKNVGSRTNGKGYKILNHFRIIWGDGIDINTIGSIYRRGVDVMGYSAENFAFGMGGALLQKVDRDTQRYAMKCSAVWIDEEGWRDVFKQPSTDIMKASKKGLVMLYKDREGKLVNLIEGSPETEGLECMLHEVFNDGIVTKRWSLKEVRANTELPEWTNAAGQSKVYAALV